MKVKQNVLFMKEAFALAKKGMGWTNPHPMVGAIVVKNGKVIAEGYHRRFGTDHAEADAFKHTKEDMRGATMYVTLEPCHLPYDLHGDRMPCTEVIKQAGIQTVHIAMLDSNPEVDGAGRKTLEKAGIKTTLGIMGDEVLQLNEAYHHFMTRNRPFIVSTFSASLDGKIATYTGDSKWISNEKARKFSHKLRAEYQAILVGINTVLKDNPHLGTRLPKKKDPLRIILDSTLKIPLDSQVLRDTNVLIATTIHADKDKQKILSERGIELLAFSDKKIPLVILLQELYKRKIISVLVEGGSQILGSFVDEQLVDKMYAFYAPILIGGTQAATTVGGEGVATITKALKGKAVSLKRFSDNILLICNFD